mmetsp:Transcript_666/g.1069  ORF Transcript_666/g.1069 Transcript_666/m.1069 type:complete len:85 (-) Transcript_666:1086-1340(-)
MLPEDDKDADSLLLALSLPKDKLVSTLRDTRILKKGRKYYSIDTEAWNKFVITNELYDFELTFFIKKRLATATKQQNQCVSFVT